MKIKTHQKKEKVFLTKDEIWNKFRDLIITML